MDRYLNIMIGLFIPVYAFSVLFFVSSAFGTYTGLADPRAAVFLLLIGEPWVRMLPLFPEHMHGFYLVFLPLISLLLVLFASRVMYARHAEKNKNHPIFGPRRNAS